VVWDEHFSQILVRIEAVDAQLEYLPPYSLDFNPIEPM